MSRRPPLPLSPVQPPIHPRMLDRGPEYPGNGDWPRRPDDRNTYTAWARLAQGGALGKKSILLYDNNIDAKQNAMVSILQIEGQDGDAQPVVVTLGSPSVIPLPFESLRSLNQQNLTGEQTNFQSGARTFPGTAGPTEWPGIMAVIEWGVGGASSRAYVDFVNGTCINLQASWLRVHAAVSEFDADAIEGTSAAYVLQAFVGPGWTHPGNAQRTIYVGEVNNNAESVVFPVPPFARRATLVGCDTSVTPGVTTGFIRFWRSAAGQAGGDNVGNFEATANQVGPFDVPNAAEFFSVFNTMGKSGVLFGVIFELSI